MICKAPGSDSAKVSSGGRGLEVRRWADEVKESFGSTAGLPGGRRNPILGKTGPRWNARHPSREMLLSNLMRSGQLAARLWLPSCSVAGVGHRTAYKDSGATFRLLRDPAVRRQTMYYSP